MNIILSVLSLVAIVNCQDISSIDIDLSTNATYEEEARGGYGGGYGGGGHGGGYGDYGGGGGYSGGHGHGTISMDPVSILGLLSLGAVILRSILTLLTPSARSLDVSDINLPLLLSDIPEAIANWQGMTHVVYERSVDNEDVNRNPMAPIHNYLSMLRTEKQCIPHFLCEFWRDKSEEEETFLDVVMLTTAGWHGSLESASIYDQLKTQGSSTVEQQCARARAKCTYENHVG